MRSGRGGAAVALCVLAWAQSARAQEGPYSNFLVGERSLGLAGAFVAVADDASAIFHNPGGLASLPTGSASGSLWTLVRGTRLVRDGYTTDLGSVDLEHSAPLSLPLFLAGVVKFGPRAKKGRIRPHALSAAIITPHNVERRFVTQLDEPDAADRLEVRSEDRARWLGLGYGFLPDRRLSLGLSGFFAMRSLRHDEIELRARETEPTASTVGSAYDHASTLEADTQHVVIRVGMRAKLAPELQAGLMFQPPGIEVDDSAEAESLTTRVGPDPINIGVQREGGLSVNLPMPWELRLGLAWVKRRAGLISLDLSLFGPAGSRRNPLPLVEAQAVELGAFVPRATYRRTSLRGALGFEALIAGLLPLRGGLFFERSSAPNVLLTSTAYSRDDMDTAGAAFSLGVRTEDFDLSVGVTGALGFGQGLGLLRDADFDRPLQYQMTDVRDTFLMIFVGGAKNAVREIVTTVVE